MTVNVEGLQRALRDISRSTPCKRCGDPTRMFATRLCDRCWELERRIGDAPDIAAQIVREMEANQVDDNLRGGD